MFYEYLPDGLSWDTLNSMVANFTADGVRCQYRIFGYRSGGGGTLIFDSGGGGMYGQSIDITGAGFDYYNILLSAFDKDGTQIAVGNIDSGYVIFSWGELVQLPTTPPELIDGVQSIEEGINGTATVTRPPSIVTTVTVTTDDVGLPDHNGVNADIMQFGAGFHIVQYTFGWLFYRSEMRLKLFVEICMGLAVVSYVLSKGW
jgi:hypothetical protein